MNFGHEDSSDEYLVNAQRKRIENEQDLLNEDYKAILKTNEGYRFFKHFLREGNILKISMTGNSMTFFNEGHRNFAIIIYNELCRANPKKAADILTELNMELIKERDNG